MKVEDCGVNVEDGDDIIEPILGNLDVLVCTRARRLCQRQDVRDVAGGAQQRQVSAYPRAIGDTGRGSG